MKKVKLALAALMLAFAFAGCMDNNGDKGSDTTAEIAAKGTVNVTVVGVHGERISGVRVSIDSKAGTTDADGILSLKDVDISGASAGSPKTYNIVATKENFANLTAIATFTQDTVVADGTDSVQLNPSTSAEVETGEGKVLVGNFVVTFKNGVANVIITMPELVTLNGTLELPVGETFDAGSVRVIPTITNLMTEVPKSDYNFEITNSTVTAGTRTVEYSIKDVPLVNVGAGVMTLNVYNAGNTNDNAPDYYYTNSNAINLVEKALTRAQAGCNLGTFKLEPYYNLTGIVYKDIEKTTPVGRGAQVNMTTNTAGSFDGKSVLTDENGRYTFHKLKAATYYPVLSAFDLNGDGRAENQESRSFDPVVMGAKKDNPTSASNTITRNLWFHEEFAYTVTGKAYLQQVNNVQAGVVVDLWDNNNKLISTTKTDANGIYRFEGVVYENVKISSPGIDTDADGNLNFKAVSAISINNTGKTNAIYTKNMILAMDESEYEVKIAETNIGTTANGVVTPKTIMAQGDKIVVTFVNPIESAYKTGAFKFNDGTTDVVATAEWSNGDKTVTLTASLTKDKTYSLLFPKLAAVDQRKFGLGTTNLGPISGIVLIQD